ncbi:MAG: topoisomerase DNA-binding C4 zinc finger domain-containing protein [bacterium]
MTVFLKVYSIEEEDEDEKSVKIPKDIKEKDDVNLQKVEGKQHFTQPPARYTEATLVKELEKQGVGRPSTYAAILTTIQKREYATKENKKFQPTELGKTVDKMLRENLPDIINVKFTAQMEEDLDKIASNELERNNVLFEFYDKFQKDLEKFKGQETKKEVLDIKCPQCGKPLVIRFGKSGSFVGCTGFPECDFTSNFKKDEKGNVILLQQEKTEISEIPCPQCGKSLIKKMGKFGSFLACPGYPECKYIHQEALKMPCPECGGKIVKRKWRGGNFWGCSNYPKCKFAIFGEVEEKPCPKCKSPYLLVKKEKDGKTILTCPNKECDYKEET